MPVEKIIRPVPGVERLDQERDVFLCGGIRGAGQIVCKRRARGRALLRRHDPGEAMHGRCADRRRIIERLAKQLGELRLASRHRRETEFALFFGAGRKLHQRPRRWFAEQSSLADHPCARGASCGCRRPGDVAFDDCAPFAVRNGRNDAGRIGAAPPRKQLLIVPGDGSVDRGAGAWQAGESIVPIPDRQRTVEGSAETADCARV